MNISCVYKIENKKNSLFYIGSTKNLHKRVLRHKNELFLGKHHNQYMQHVYNKHGKIFEYHIVETCLPKDLLAREQYWIDKLNPKYNIGPVGGGDNYTNHPNKELIKEKLVTILKLCKRMPRFKSDNSNWRGGKTYFTCPICKKELRTNRPIKTCGKCRDRSGKSNPFYGKSHSNKTKQKLRESNIGKIPSNAKKCTIDSIVYPSAAEAARQLKMKPATLIHRLKSPNVKFKTWRYLHESN